MESTRVKDIENIYATCRRVLGLNAWIRVIEACGKSLKSETFADSLAALQEKHIIPDFLPELAKLEWIRYVVTTREVEIPHEIDKVIINPTVELLHLSWHLAQTLIYKEGIPSVFPHPGEEWVVVWREIKTGKVNVDVAKAEDLLALKIVVEGISLEEATKLGNLPKERIEATLHYAIDKGILLAPPSRIRRNTNSFPIKPDTPELFLSPSSFTLQWHITHACDLHCKHCYDRSKRSPLTLKQAYGILNDLLNFCRSYHVKGHVCFTGGNPLLYPYFYDLYHEAAKRCFSTSILGNPAPREQIEEILAIQKPNYYQVSLEGLPDYNDEIRGPGYFNRVIEFLGILRDLDISSTVMLTLNKDNINQVIPLADRLRGHADYFTFNRLSRVGEGASLQLPGLSDYAAFLREYVEAAQRNPIIGFKDNLINIIHHQRHVEPFGGCTDYGCGAAFNFITVLPDGEVHACRKFPSPIGNILEQNITEIYESDIAKRYREGSFACRSCDIRPVCGGCLAVTYSYDLDVFKERDPHCFIDD
jgi:selenobiotic family peptide radical SAM maturase